MPTMNIKNNELFLATIYIFPPTTRTPHRFTPPALAFLSRFFLSSFPPLIHSALHFDKFLCFPAHRTGAVF